jgi:hypothetical protein
MKITLDISKLVEEGKLTPAEAERLKTLASHDTGSLGINILIGFGVVAIAAGAGALSPTPFTAMGIGVVSFIAGLAIALSKSRQWDVLGQICLIIGALMFSGGVIAYGDGSLNAMLIVTAVLTGGALVARASLLMVLAVLAASACLGAKTGYSHATYSLAIFEPTLTVLLFSSLALVAYLASKRLPADYERVALTAARTSILLVNFGFWIGSLWGDPLFLVRRLSGKPAARFDDAIISTTVFSIGWAVVLLAAGIWAARVNRRWLVNVVAVFGAIHFYTQWFEKLGANAISVLGGGVLMLVIALALWAFNRRSVAV